LYFKSLLKQGSFCPKLRNEKARKARLHQDAIDKMEDIRREKQQLDKILRGITIDKK
jgi:uncharacterized protein YydD (DUF2326 family)